MTKLSYLATIWLAANQVAAVNQTLNCDAICQTLANLGATYEAEQHADPNLTFYQTPSNFSQALAPGTVLAVENETDMSNFLVPYTLTMSRIIYTTTDLNGTVQPASAYVLWPYVQPGESGFPAYHFMVPFALAMQGVAVIAPDYAGLGIGSLPDGSPVPHAYSASPAQANDLANAVTAARAAFPSALADNGPFVVSGHSQGGGVAWAFAERQAQQPVDGYRGTVALAPAVRLIPWIEDAIKEYEANMTEGNALATQNKVIAGITAVFPQYNYSGMTDDGYDRWHNGLAKVQGCLPTDSLIQGVLVQNGVSPLALVHSNWTEASIVQEFKNRTKVGGKNLAGPLLVLAGEIDLVPVKNIEDVVDETCQVLAEAESTESVEFVAFSKANHFPLIQASQQLWMGWIKDRLAGIPACKKRAGPVCKKSVVEGFRTNHAIEGQRGSLPNWLVTGVPAKDSWKYTL